MLSRLGNTLKDADEWTHRKRTVPRLEDRALCSLCRRKMRMPWSLDEVALYRGHRYRIFDFKTVNRRPGAEIFLEETNCPDRYTPSPLIDVELYELHRLKKIA
jgi:hypothetical protein